MTHGRADDGSSGHDVDIWWTDDVLPFADAATSLSPTERARADRFHFDHDRQRFVARHAALRTLLSTYAGCPPDALAVETAAHGRPYLAGHDAGIAFNLAHSGNAALYAVSPLPVGVDLEHIRVDLDLPGLVARICSRREQSALAELRDASLTAAFFACWTHKEAICKGDGRGLTLAPSTIDVADAITTGRALADVPGPATVAGWRSTSLALAAGTAGAVAVPAGQRHRLVVRHLSRDAGGDGTRERPAADH
ncbi:hypothetical protein BH23ACT10_BH23ACT10_17690 [soil metagenome]